MTTRTTRSFQQDLRSSLRGQSFQFYFLAGVTSVLLALGMVMVGSASSVDSVTSGTSAFGTLRTQGLVLAIGLVLMLVGSLLPWSTYEKWSGPAVVLALALQAFASFAGTTINGNRNWISFGQFGIQPSEFLKIALILFVAVQLQKLHESEDNERSIWLGIAAAVGLSLVLVGYASSDLGSAAIFVLFLAGMLFLAGIKLRYLLSAALVLVAIAWIAVTARGNRLNRITAWMNPDAPDPTDIGWQFEHGTWALAEGQLLGTGLGQSKLKWNWIPEAENDFIFAIIGEELGLLGAATVVALFIALAVALLMIARLQMSFGAQMFVSGVMLWLLLQGLVNISVVLGVFPILGVTLPFISAGGSSLLSGMLAIGVVLGVERGRHNTFKRSRA